MLNFTIMGARRTLVNDIVINELAFDALFHLAQPEHRDKLTAVELRAATSAKTARFWSENTTLDEKLMLFAKIGISGTFFLHPIKWKYKKEIEKFREMTKGEQLDMMAKTKLVAVSDKQIANTLSVMSKISHSDTYILNMDFHRVGNFVTKWKDQRANVEKLTAAFDGASEINRLSFSLIMALKTIKGKTRFFDLDIILLMFFYENKDGYVSRTTIEDGFGGVFKKTLITAAIKRLTVTTMIERSPLTNEPEYQITALGITTVMDFHAKNLQSV